MWPLRISAFENYFEKANHKLWYCRFRVIYGLCCLINVTFILMLGRFKLPTFRSWGNHSTCWDIPVTSSFMVNCFRGKLTILSCDFIVSLADGRNVGCYTHIETHKHKMSKVMFYNPFYINLCRVTNLRLLPFPLPLPTHTHTHTKYLNSSATLLYVWKSLHKETLTCHKRHACWVAVA